MRALKGKRRAARDDPGPYARDAARFAKLSASLADTEARLAAAEDQWLTLELMREEVEG